MNLNDDIRYMNERLKVLKGHKIKLEYDGKVLLEKIDPTAEELLLALYNVPNYEEQEWNKNT